MKKWLYELHGKRKESPEPSLVLSGPSQCGKTRQVTRAIQQWFDPEQRRLPSWHVSVLCLVEQDYIFFHHWIRANQLTDHVSCHCWRNWKGLPGYGRNVPSTLTVTSRKRKQPPKRIPQVKRQVLIFKGFQHATTGDWDLIREYIHSHALLVLTNHNPPPSLDQGEWKAVSQCSLGLGKQIQASTTDDERRWLTFCQERFMNQPWSIPPRPTETKGTVVDDSITSIRLVSDRDLVYEESVQLTKSWTTDKVTNVAYKKGPVRRDHSWQPLPYSQSWKTQKDVDMYLSSTVLVFGRREPQWGKLIHALDKEGGVCLVESLESGEIIHVTKRDFLHGKLQLSRYPIVPCHVMSIHDVPRCVPPHVHLIIDVNDKMLLSALYNNPSLWTRVSSRSSIRFMDKDKETEPSREWWSSAQS